MAEEKNPFLDEEIPDPTDFPTDAPGLRALDESLRCTICKELFEAPVTVNCSHGHCFCSLCIRSLIRDKAECPLCRQAILEVYLRRNPVMEDAIKAWKLSRPFVVGLLRERDDAKQAVHTTNSDVSTPRKRKRQSAESDDDIAVVAGDHADHITRSKYFQGSSNSRPSLKPKSSSKSSGASEQPETVECPICQNSIPYNLINSHIDNGCKLPAPLLASSSTVASPKAKKTQKQEWSKVFRAGDPGPSTSRNRARVRTPPTPEIDLANAEPIPKMSYSALKDKVIRDRLAEYGLPIEGDKAALIARHQHWVAMFNANLDASGPSRKTVAQLRKELKKWEEAEAAETAKKAKPNNLDLNTYVRENKAAFARLIEQARPPKSPQKMTAIELPEVIEVDADVEASDTQNLVEG